MQDKRVPWWAVLVAVVVAAVAGNQVQPTPAPAPTPVTTTTTSTIPKPVGTTTTIYVEPIPNAGKPRFNPNASWNQPVWDVSPLWAERFRGSHVDPFYRDDRLPEFVQALFDFWLEHLL